MLHHQHIDDRYHSVGTLTGWLLDFPLYYDQIANRFEWKFIWNLNVLLNKIIMPRLPSGQLIA
jgi:hypothetical protein